MEVIRSEASGEEAPFGDQSARLAPVLERALPLIESHLRDRFRSASPLLIERCVRDAAEGCNGARITVYLPILVERWASEGVRRRIGSHIASGG